MGFDLKPRNKAAGMYHAIGWTWMLEAGVGLVLCVGRGVEPGTFVYRMRPDGNCPYYNDGCRVSAKEAREMARLARLLADYQDVLYDVWMKTPEDKRARIENRFDPIYHLPVRRDFVGGAREFADWAEKSGGFEIH